MQITSLKLTNFRNHQNLLIEDAGRVLIIVGDNAVGKTNIIEALQLLSMHESFRRPHPEELICKQSLPGQPAQIQARLDADNCVNEKQLTIIEDNRSYIYNGKERPARELEELLPAVLFTPDDLYIIKGAPEKRRDMLDSLGARLSKTFAQIRSDYYKSLRHKNSLLKNDEVDLDLLDSWNTNLAKLGDSLIKHRVGLFAQLIEVATVKYQTISGGELLTGEYLDSSLAIASTAANSEIAGQAQSDDSLYTVLCMKREQEIAARRSLFGPHKDDVAFCINGNDVRRFASQGQQRTISLALKIAEIEVLRRFTGNDPLLLLDDVMSELDASRRSYFLDIINESSQTVITTTNLGYFTPEFLNKASIVQL